MKNITRTKKQVLTLIKKNLESKLKNIKKIILISL